MVSEQDVLEALKSVAGPDGRTPVSRTNGVAGLTVRNDKVYLAASDNNPNLRGLLVEVDSGGNVGNVGKIIAERGNITLLGLAVNQGKGGVLRATTSVDARRLQDALDKVTSVHDQLAALGQGATGLADLDEHDLDAVRAAINSGLGGVLADYNAAVDQRTALDPQHDATVEQLRQQANAVITALDSIS